MDRRHFFPTNLIRRLSGLGVFLLLTFIALAWPAFRIAKAQGGVDLQKPPVWMSKDTGFFGSVAWGDYDRDGDLDVVVGNANGGPHLYRNDRGTLTPLPVWTSPEDENTLSVAWGDYDGDGDLDLAVGNYQQPNRIYRNDGLAGETSVFTVVWISSESRESNSVAWGDADGDGDLDLAVGNDDGANHLYINQGLENGVPIFALGWTSPVSEATTALAWADVDGDGDLDLAVGNSVDEVSIDPKGRNNRLYRNVYSETDHSSWFTTVWTSALAYKTNDVAWGDYDRDGDLDLAVGNDRAPNHIYRNDGGNLTSTPVWTSSEREVTMSVAWGDIDGDGYLDLAEGNICYLSLCPDRVYANHGGVLVNSSTWDSSDNEDTYDIAWGDVDGDGALDLFTARSEILVGRQSSKLYRNKGALLARNGASFGDSSSLTTSVAWGDVNGDGYLDLAVGNTGGDASNHLYLNQEGVLSSTPIWTAAENDATFSVAWGDADGDGDLDLAVGNNGPNFVYRNDDGDLPLTPTWRSTEAVRTTSIAWGDIDGDGDLDLAAGNAPPLVKAPAPNHIYRNDTDDNGLFFTLVWTSTEMEDYTNSVAWGDYDSDGDLDLAVGNLRPTPLRLYRNEGGRLTTTAVWTSPQEDETQSIAWGDVDGDGDLDLAAGNRGDPNLRLYLNERLNSKDHFDGSAWTSTEDEGIVNSVAWGDYDGDGDLDLAIGSDPDGPRGYRNEDQQLTTETVWSAAQQNSTTDIAWGDIDGDGDLDLAAGNSGSANQIYRNRRRNSAPLDDDPPYPHLARPGLTKDAFFFSTPQILTGPVVLTYTLYDPEGDPVARLFPEYSPTGGGKWRPATPANGQTLINLATSPDGVTHTFIWDAEKDLVESDQLIFRLQAQADQRAGSILWPALDGKSPPFRFAAPGYIKVVDAVGRPQPGATVYADGQALTNTVTGVSVTDAAGLLNPGHPLPPGTALMAVASQFTQTTERSGHDGWAYTVNLANLPLDAAGAPQVFEVERPGPQILTASTTLVLFNLVVSIEWDAEEAYMQDVALALERAAAFLYDATDGQMTFGRVTICDQAEQWAVADIQISAKNIVQPHAYVKGLIDRDSAPLIGRDSSHLIRVGRFWDGRTGDRGAWSEENGFKTLVHEFGHYGLGLYDEYFGYDTVNGVLAGRHVAYCTGPENYPAAGQTPDASAAGSIMDYHYNTSELVDKSRWTAWCQKTVQHQLNDGKADWETLLDLYSDSSGRWSLLTPDQRVGPGKVVAGPEAIPDAAPFPVIDLDNKGADPPPVTLTVCHNGAIYRDGAWVTLYFEGKAMDQGLTNNAGQLMVLGGSGTNELRIISQDGLLSGSAFLPLAGPIELNAPSSTLNALAGGSGPYLRLWPTTDNGRLDGVRLAATGAFEGDVLLAALTGSDGVGPTKAIPYDPVDQDHRVHVNFVPDARTGYAKVLGAHAGQSVNINVDYRLQQATALTETDLFSNDGNFKLHVAADALPASLETVHFLIASPWGLPGPPTPGLEIVGEVYEITAANNVTALTKPAVLRLRYDLPADLTAEELTIYRWNFATSAWQSLAGEIDAGRQAVATTIAEMGIYTLMGKLAPAADAPIEQNASVLCSPAAGNFIYLPAVMKN